MTSEVQKNNRIFVSVVKFASVEEIYASLSQFMSQSQQYMHHFAMFTPLTAGYASRSLFCIIKLYK
ncbi:hypothetical protein [Cytobacillus horneckiae]|uniref:hypothetical protein n=1 Tax=Cytobacillus horneckiae TaxID=549687 RepID=UPI003D20A364